MPSIKKFFAKPFFSAAMGDDVLLSKKAQALLTEFNLPLKQQDIKKITREHGIDMATRCYYEYLLVSKHGLFKKKIDQYPDDLCYKADIVSKKNSKLLIIPGMFYQEHPEVGSDGQLIIAIAKQCGFDVELLQTGSKDSIQKNTDILNRNIVHQQAANIWLISMSKGSSEVQNYFKSCNVPSSIKGWLNIAGINQGSPHAARKLSTKPKKLLYAILCKLMKVNYQVLNELHPEHPIWATPSWTSRIDCIHVIPIPLRSHIQSRSKKHYEQLLPYGPNDGMVPVYDAEQLPGKIYPLWGVDHFIRTPDIAKLLYQFFAYIAQQETQIKTK